MKKFTDLGGRIVVGRKVASLSDVAQEFGFDVVVNCTGVQARHLGSILQNSISAEFFGYIFHLKCWRIVPPIQQI
jgi:hypothetical protein